MATLLEELAINLLNEILDQIPGLAQSQQLEKISGQISFLQTQVGTVDENVLLGNDNNLRLLNEINFGVQRLLANAAAPVILPQQPPQGYGGPATGDVATAVWAFRDPLLSQPAIDLLDDTALFAINATTATSGFVAAGNPPWIGAGAWTSSTGPEDPTRFLPFVDFTTIHTTDATISAWLNRVYPGNGIFDLGNGWAAQSDRAGAFQWIFGMSPWEFAEIKAGLTPATGARVPPVWPGLANVTLGTTVALVDGLVVTGPLDGVIVKITAVPNPIGFYPFGTRKSFVHVGGIVFIDDNGEAEQSIPLGLDDEVICSRLTEHPASATIRLKAGVVGTVQPWLMS